MRSTLRSVISVVVAFAALGVGVGGFLLRQHDLRSLSQRQCTQIEELKEILRPEPFNEQAVRRLARDLGIDPDSPRGRELIDEERREQQTLRRKLAPDSC